LCGPVRLFAAARYYTTDSSNVSGPTRGPNALAHFLRQECEFLFLFAGDD
jgi:hypothetical protein